MNKKLPLIVIASVFVLFLAINPTAFAKKHSSNTSIQHNIPIAELPPEALQTLALIKQGGPFPHKRDGIVFHNREKRLPKRPKDYYREYTVRTPGVKHRGARRIVAGRQGELYYTEDHYKSFKRIQE